MLAAPALQPQVKLLFFLMAILHEGHRPTCLRNCHIYFTMSVFSVLHVSSYPVT